MILAANWKMNLLPDSAHELALAYHKMASTHADEMTAQNSAMVIFPPALYASDIHQMCQGTDITWGGQASRAELNGAYTGDMSAPMFAAAGASWQLVGHSERRALHHETDEDIAAQHLSAQQAGLRTMLCVGESLSDRQAGKAEEVVSGQLKKAISQATDFSALTIAYEPIWAIGTGHVAEPSDVEAMHRAIADICQGQLGAVDRPKILYGGSVKASNAAALFGLSHVDGALIGGASLIADEFEAILLAALEIAAQS